MAPAELEHYLHAHIPLSRAMAVAVLSIADDHVLLGAPLAPNVNHRDTVFGGSASALAMLAGWSLLQLRLSAAGLASRLVIQRNSVEYERPIAGDFTARAVLEHPDRWQPFTQMLARRGRARVAVSVVLVHAEQIAGRFRGEFVASRAPG